MEMGVTITHDNVAYLIHAMRKGSSLTYHKGFLALDKDAHRFSADIRKLARAVWTLYEAGFVTLTQRRLGPFSYEYIAVRV